jgi:hypothetical protein
MTKKRFIMAVVSGIIISLCLSCSNNPLANTTWQDTEGTRTIVFGESTFRWKRDDSGFDEKGTYTISKDAVVLIYDSSNSIAPDKRQTGSLNSGVLSFTATLEAQSVTFTHINVEFHRVR